MLTIRLSRIGKKKKPFYRVVVIERTRPRNGRIREAVGTYDPLKKPAEIKLDAERIKRGMGWKQVAGELPGFTASMLTNLGTGPLIGFPRVMMITQWLGRPAASFVRDHDR